MSRGLDAGTLLRRALVHDAAACGCTIAAEVTDMTRWASATFTGARHRLSVAGAADAAIERWLAALPDADLPLRRHLVADIGIVSVARCDGVMAIEIEALTVED